MPKRQVVRHLLRAWRWTLPLFVCLWATGFGLCACRDRHAEETVVVYTSVDQVFSEPIFKQFEAETGIRVLAVYDVEAAKTTGLVNRLIAEKPQPQADVFWSGEFAQTLLLKERGVLEAYAPPAAGDIPSRYRDPDGAWTGFAGRARVILVNTDKVPEENTPHSIFDLLDPRWPEGSVGIAYPLFGTTLTQAAALYAEMGADAARAFFESLVARGVRVVDGNSVVRDMVARGELMVGLTDTDDACGALDRGAPVSIILPDQDGMGTLIIPNSIAVIAKGPHPDAAREFVDFLLSPDVEDALIASGWSHVSLHGRVPTEGCLAGQSIRGMEVDLTEIYAQMEQVQSELRETYVR